MSINWAEIGVFVSVCGSVAVSLCFAIQKSHCDRIKCCCIDIHRKVPDDTPEQPQSPTKDIERGNIPQLQNTWKP